MAKRLKLATIEKRFNKLHNAANFAEQYAHAIATHAQLLIHGNQSGPQNSATQNMVDALNEWAVQFAPLGTEMGRVEARYTATIEGDTAELIEAIPSTNGYRTEEPYKLTDILCRIGVIPIPGDPYETADKNYTDDEIVDNVQTMYHSLTICVKALALATYQGIWSDASKMAADIYYSYPSDAINSFLTAYGIEEEFF